MRCLAGCQLRKTKQFKKKQNTHEPGERVYTVRSDSDSPSLPTPRRLELRCHARLDTNLAIDRHSSRSAVVAIEAYTRYTTLDGSAP